MLKKLFSGMFLIFLAFSSQCSKDCSMDDKCYLEPESGPCYAVITRYYFDQNEGKCKEFIWGGCDGVVPFQTLQECEYACSCDD